MADRDSQDRVRFSPLQTLLSQKLCAELFGAQHHQVNLFTTAVLIESREEDLHPVVTNYYYTHSDAILRLLLHLGFPYSVAGRLLLFAIPKFLRDYGYRVFARHRGTIWKGVQRVTGLGETSLYAHRDRILGVVPDDDNELSSSTAERWGLQKPKDDDGSQTPSC